MDQPYDPAGYSYPETAPEYIPDFGEMEFASQEIKPFKIAALFQEAEQAAKNFTPRQLDEALLLA